MSEITTYTGKHIDPVNPKAELIDIRDIAHALSLTCRGNGQVKTFFSVGSHCILCSKEAKMRGLSKRMQLACLIHDASEAYMSDVPRPLKNVMSEYSEYEDALLSLIYEKFLGSDLSSDEQKLLKQIDNDLMFYDLRELLGENTDKEEPKINVSLCYDFVPFKDVEAEYLELFYSLSDEKEETACLSDEKAIKEKLSHIKVFVLDMDGTIYLGNRLFPYTKDFLNAVKKSGRDFCFFTNNSSKNFKSYIDKLDKMGINVRDNQMLISNGVMTDWLNENRSGQKAYVVGTPDLENAVKQAGIEISETKADYVLLGFDTTLNYEKLVKACDFVRDGKEIFGLNPDFNCPTETGFIPDCGSMAALIKASTGVQCEFFGKPSRHTLDYMLKVTGCEENELCVIGDRLYTDIAVADGTPVTSILVLSGESTLHDAAKSEFKPDLIVNNIGELIPYL